MFDEYTVNTIEISPTERVRVVYDIDPRNPLTDWEMGISLYPLTVGRNYSPLESGKDAHHEALAIIVEWAGESAITRHFERANVPFQIVEISAERDFVGRYVAYQDEEGTYLEGALKTLQAYFDGEVYGLMHEVRETYANVNDDEDTHTHWESVDSVWGFIGYSDAELIETAAESFTYATESASA